MEGVLIVQEKTIGVAPSLGSAEAWCEPGGLAIVGAWPLCATESKLPAVFRCFFFSMMVKHGSSYW